MRRVHRSRSDKQPCDGQVWDGEGDYSRGYAADYRICHSYSTTTLCCLAHRLVDSRSVFPDLFSLELAEQAFFRTWGRFPRCAGKRLGRWLAQRSHQARQSYFRPIS